ncbi:MAG: hypothetical protein EOO06_03340 [Chitinophagaceae bacterium]|nr:MAG: hypothetical protein EOO06_03340 [Chitinophagaceae bacterium]
MNEQNLLPEQMNPTSATDAVTQAAVVLPQPSEVAPIHQFRSYDQGVVDGLMQNCTAPFESFVEAYHRNEWRQQQVAALRLEIDQLKSEQAKARAERAVVERELIGRRKEWKRHDLRLGQLRRVEDYWREKLAEARAHREQWRNNVHDYNLPGAFLLLVFGFLFLAADYALCLNIVADGLKVGMNGTEPGPQAHLFALALCGLGMLLKPAYDRLVEKPYQEGEGRQRFAWVILALAGSVLILLLLLGVLREELISALSDSSSNVDPNAITLDAPEPSAAAPFALSGWACAGIVLSTMLFALAGAVSLGICLPVFHRNFRIHWNRMRSRFWNRKLQEAQEQCTGVETQQAEADIEMKALEQQLTRLESTIQVDARLLEQQQLLQVQEHSGMTARIAVSQALYQTGQERGQKLTGKVPEETLYQQAYTGATQPEDGARVLELQPRKSSNLFGQRTRPFVALRRMISQGFRKQALENDDVNIDYYG